jgi:hypothetical protein
MKEQKGKWLSRLFGGKKEQVAAEAAVTQPDATGVTQAAVPDAMQTIAATMPQDAATIAADERRQLEKITAEWQGPPPLPWEQKP